MRLPLLVFSVLILALAGCVATPPVQNTASKLYKLSVDERKAIRTALKAPVVRGNVNSMRALAKKEQGGRLSICGVYSVQYILGAAKSYFYGTMSAGKSKENIDFQLVDYSTARKVYGKSVQRVIAKCKSLGFTIR